MARNQRVEHLQDVSLFAACTAKELALIAMASDEVEVESGTVVVREGDFGHEFFLILTGRAEVTRAGAPVAELHPGHYFGELALLDGAPRDATVTTTTPARLLVLRQPEFAALLDATPGVARNLLIQMAGRLRAAEAASVTH